MNNNVEIENKYTWHIIPTASINHLQELEIISLQIVGNDICITRKNNQFLAFSNKCPHAGALFIEGGYVDSKGNVVCPLHGYKYDTVSGKSQTGDSYQLYCYPIKQVESTVYVGIKNIEKK